MMPLPMPFQGHTPVLSFVHSGKLNQPIQDDVRSWQIVLQKSLALVGFASGASAIVGLILVSARPSASSVGV
jgi:hypothetical protein